MVLGIGPPPVDAPSGPETMLGTHHDGEKEQEALSDATKGSVHVAVCAESTADHCLCPQ